MSKVSIDNVVVVVRSVKHGRFSSVHVGADLPPSIVDLRLRQAQEIIEELLKPVVWYLQIGVFSHH